MHTLPMYFEGIRPRIQRTSFPYVLLLVSLRLGVPCLLLPCLLMGCTIRQGSGGTDPTGTSSQIPDNQFCQPVAEDSWDPAWSTLEQELLTAINAVRAEGTSCGSRGSFGPTHAVDWNGSLACAARVHVEDMGERDYFDHNSPEGDTVADRMAAAGYSASSYGEILTASHSTAAAAVARWLESNDHCALLMEPAFTEAGAGWYEAVDSTYGTYQDITFGTPK